MARVIVKCVMNTYIYSLIEEVLLERALEVSLVHALQSSGRRFARQLWQIQRPHWEQQ